METQTFFVKSHPTVLDIIWGSLTKRWSSHCGTSLYNYFYPEVTEILGRPPLSIDQSLIDFGDLPIFFQRSISTSDASRHGVVYTPPWLAEQLCRDLKHSLSNAQKILDPACGSGIFLIAVLLELLKESRRSVKDLEDIAARLYGIDRDRNALLVARMILSTIVCEQIPNGAHGGILEAFANNIIHGDALLPEKTYPQRHWVSGSDFFDIVIGNPPYGLSRDEQLTREENALLKIKYHSYLNGRVNKYILFIARAHQLLKPAGGEYCLIVPNALLGIKEAKVIRKLLLMGGGLEEIEILNKETFRDTGVETVVIKGKRGSTKKSVLIKQGDQSSLLPHRRCLSLPGQVIPTSWSEKTERFIENLLLCPLTLGGPDSPFLPRIALQAYAANKGRPPQTKDEAKEKTFHTDVKVDESCVPYLHGKEVSAYNVSWTGQYLKYGPWLAEPQSLNFFSGPRILIREIVQKPPRVLIATFTRDAFLYNKSILHILPREGCGEDMLYALTAILQSSLISYWLQILGRKTQRTLFPKILLDDLQQIPLPSINKDDYRELSTLSREAHITLSIEQQKKIDGAVFELYKVASTNIPNLFNE